LLLTLTTSRLFGLNARAPFDRQSPYFDQLPTTGANHAYWAPE